MANFKPGDRVKRVRTGPSNGLADVPLNSEGTVVADGGGEFVRVEWDRLGPEYLGGYYRYTLAPLTDPKADAFIERIKKLADRKIVTTREGVFELAGGESKRISALTKGA